MTMRLPVHIWIREENASPEEIAGYFTELARHLDARPQKMRLVIESTVPVCLDFDPKDGDPIVSVSGNTRKFHIRHRWIPEHPVPLVLGMDPEGGGWRFRISRFFSSLRRTVLLIDPVDGNRFRVRAKRAVQIPVWCYALFAVTAVTAVVTFHPVAIVVAIMLFAFLIGISVVSEGRSL